MYSIDKIIINAIIYIIVTAFFAYLLINEKILGEKIKVYRGIFSEKIMQIFKVEKSVKAEKSRTEVIIRKTVDWTEMLISAIILVLLIQHFYIGNFLVPTGSMIPTIQPGDRLLGDMVSYKFIKPSRGDVIVFKEPIEDKVLYTKRLIGYPGERVKIGEDGNVYVNNKLVLYKSITINDIKKIEIGKAGKIYIEDKEILNKKMNSNFIERIKITKTGKVYVNGVEVFDKKIKSQYSINLNRKNQKIYVNNKEIVNEKLEKEGITKIEIALTGEIYLNGEEVSNVNVKYVRKGFMSDKEWVIPKKGDTIEVIGGHMYIENEKVEDIDIASFQQMMEINDKAVTERIPYARFLLNGKDETGPIFDFRYDKKMAERLFNGEKIVLDKDYYLVLGDNSNNSFDSRFWGFVAEDRIKGRPFMRFFPLNRIGLLK